MNFSLSQFSDFGRNFLSFFCLVSCSEDVHRVGSPRCLRCCFRPYSPIPHSKYVPESVLKKQKTQETLAAKSEAQRKANKIVSVAKEQGAGRTS